MSFEFMLHNTKQMILYAFKGYSNSRKSNCRFLDSIKVEKILKGSLDSIPSPSTSVKIQMKGRKVCLRCKYKTFKLLKTKPSHQLFEFLLKVVGSNPGYRLKPFPL